MGKEKFVTKGPVNRRFSKGKKKRQCVIIIEERKRGKGAKPPEP